MYGPLAPLSSNETRYHRSHVQRLCSLANSCCYSFPRADPRLTSVLFVSPFNVVGNAATLILLSLQQLGSHAQLEATLHASILLYVGQRRFPFQKCLPRAILYILYPCISWSFAYCSDSTKCAKNVRQYRRVPGLLIVAYSLRRISSCAVT